MTIIGISARLVNSAPGDVVRRGVSSGEQDSNDGKAGIGGDRITITSRITLRTHDEWAGKIDRFG